MSRLNLEPRSLTLPAPLCGLIELAGNLWWCWNSEAQDLFRELDPDAWNRHGNPARMLSDLAPGRIEALAQDPGFLGRLETTVDQLRHYVKAEETWYGKAHAVEGDELVAYLSAEFGLHESLPIYCGGLGVLAGDHMKAASDLGVPLVGIGLLYRSGYFKQSIGRQGGQNEEYPQHDWQGMPMARVLAGEGDDAKPLTVEVPVAGRLVPVEVWAVQVGRNYVLLLSTDMPGATDRDRNICARLYGPERENRFEQELVLGVGAVLVLEALGLAPTVWHMNEGHSAFQTLPRLSRAMERDDLSFEEAVESVAAASVFTTHTPVPAGNEAFDLPLARRMLTDHCGALGIDMERFIDLGRKTRDDGGDELSLTVLALRLSRHANGVSALHGEVSRDMWRYLWPGSDAAEVPIGSVTNGVHTHTWMAPAMARFIHDEVGSNWGTGLVEGEVSDEARKLSSQRFWDIKQDLKSSLVGFVREREMTRREREGIAGTRPEDILDPKALTIGFARRFAPYKRANLLFSDLGRLHQLLWDPERPVQFIFAGKAYPTDTEGKKLVQRVGEVAAHPQFRGRVILLENYDMRIGRQLVQGVDVWLNNPRRPMEASGTSGQKVPLNGGVNLSVLDGWWPEAHDGTNGWAIGRNENSASDRGDAEDLYRLLKEEIVPRYYRREPDSGLPLEWIETMRASLATVVAPFSADRMVREYVEGYYLPTARLGRSRSENGAAVARRLAATRARLERGWESLAVEDLKVRGLGSAEGVRVTFRLASPALDAEDAVVEFCLWPEEGGAPKVVSLSPGEDGCYEVRFSLPAGETPRFGIRLRASAKDLLHPLELNRMTWVFPAQVPAAC